MKSPRPSAKSRLPRGFLRRRLRPVHPAQRPAVRAPPVPKDGAVRVGAPVLSRHLPWLRLRFGKQRRLEPWRMAMGLSWILLGAAGRCCCVAACWCDVKSRTIPNWLNLAIALLAIPFWWSIGLPLWPDVGDPDRRRRRRLRLVRGRLRDRRDGRRRRQADRARSRLWLPLQAVVLLLFIMSVAGGVLTLGMYLRHRLAKTRRSSSKFPTASPSRSAVCG